MTAADRWVYNQAEDRDPEGSGSPAADVQREAEQARLERGQAWAKRWEQERTRSRFHTADVKYAYQHPDPGSLPNHYEEMHRRNQTTWWNPTTFTWEGTSAMSVHLSEETLAAATESYVAWEQEKIEDMVNIYERAYLAYQGEIPMSWWIHQDPDDVRLLTEMDDFDPSAVHRLADDIYSMQKYMQAQEDREAEIERRTEELVENEMRGRSMFGQIFRALSGVEQQGSMAEGHHYSNLPDWVQTEEDVRNFYSEQVRRELVNGVKPPEAEMGWIGAGMNGIAAAFMVAGRGMDKAAPYLAYVSDPILPGDESGAFERGRQEFEEEKQELISELRRQQNMGSPAVLDELMFLNADDAWRRLQEQEPAVHQEYMDMAGGDEVIAFGFFGADMEDTIMGPTEQMQMLLENEEQAYEAQIAVLEEQDYRPSSKVMEAMAAYGKHVPMRLATATTLLLTDDDVLQDAVVGKWETLWTEVEKAEFSPAEALGIGNTAAGLMLDLATGIAFDPTTWIFGPRLKSNAGRATTGAQATHLAKTGYVRRTAQDLVRMARSPSRGNMGVAVVGDWLSEVGLLGEFLHAVGVRVKQRFGRPWRKADARAPYVDEIDTNTVMRMLDDADLERLDNLEGQVLDDLAASVDKDGFHSAIEVEFSLEDGTFHIADGGKRLRMAADNGIEQVPVTVRVKTSTRVGVPVIEGMDPATVRHLVDLANGRVKSTTGPVNNLGLSFRMMRNNTPDVSGRNGYQTVGVVEAGGKKYKLRRLTDDGTGIADGPAGQNSTVSYYLVDEDGIVIAGATKDGVQSLHVWVDDAYQGQGIMSQIFDEAREIGDELLEASGRSGQLSEMGRINAARQAQRYFEQKGIEWERLPGPKGKALSELMPEGAELPKISHRARAYDATVGDKVYVRPSKFLGEELSWGAVDNARIEGIIEEALKRGAVLPNAHRLATASGWRGAIIDGLRRSRPGRWIKRHMSPQSIVTRLERFGATAHSRMIETVMRIWGDDVARADHWIGRILDEIERSAKVQNAYAQEVARLAGARKQLQAMDDLLGGGWDDAFRLMDDPLSSLPDDVLDVVPAHARTPEGFRAWFDDLQERILAAEKRSDPADWTPEMRAASEAGDWETFSRLRGYTEAEIDDFRLYQQLVGDMEPTGTRLYPEGSPNAGSPAQVIDADEVFQGIGSRGISDDTIRQAIDDMSPQNWEQAKANRAQARKARDDWDAYVTDEYYRIDNEFGPELDDSLPQIIQDMFDDYNRTYIATNPAWAGRVDPDTGMVPWEELRKGKPRGAEKGAHEGTRRVLTDAQVQRAIDEGIENPERLARYLNSVQDIETGIELPLSPLEMVMATEVGGAAYTRLTQHAFVHGVREGAMNFMKWWIIDKVLSPATAMTVSFDELQRLFHYGGNEAIFRWAADKVIHTRARVNALFYHGKLGARHGAKHLPKRLQERMRVLQDYPTYLKQAERQTLEGMGLGWDDIFPDEPGYADAASRWMGGWMQDSGFRAYLRGPEAFREWFGSGDGRRVRTANVIDRGQSRLPKWQEAYDGYDTLLRHVIFEPGAPMDDIIRALQETGKRVDDLGGGRAIEPPLWVFEHLGPVRGVKKQPPSKHGITAISDAYFDTMLMNPVNYRRGFLAELIRKHESQRLLNLFEDQGLTVIPDSQLQTVLGLDGMGMAVHGSQRKLLHEAARKYGYVTQGYIDDLVEHRVVSEIDNILFTWDKGSRLGQQGRIIFPFGRPWADMMGFWGREVLQRPMLRGFVGRVAGPSAQDAAQGLANFIPFNPKPAAMASRLAATDFEVEGMFSEGDLPMGAEGVDFSPLLFMPVGGENPFVSMVPGLGIVPLWAIDRLIESRYDPVEEPEEYQDLMDSVADFIPAIGYQRGGTISRILGGGTTGATAEVLVDLFGTTGRRPFFNLTSELGDIGREINRSREISAILADPEEYEALVNAPNAEAALLALEGLALEADKRASRSHGLETFMRRAMPASWDFDESLDQIYSVWRDVGEQFGDMLGLPENWQPADPGDFEAQRQQANDIRSAFFDLPQWRRDLLIAQNPAIAVNLVSSWEYTPLGIASLGIEETATSYRTDGTRAGILRHQQLVDNGYIRPIEPITKAQRILGLQQAAKDASVKEIYTKTAEFVNEQLWEGLVSDETKALLDQIAASGFGQARGYENGQEVWLDWNRLETELEDAVARANGVTEDMEEWDEIKEMVSIPSKQKAWGTSWNGLAAGFSQRFEGLTFNQLPPEAQEIAEGLDIELLPGMTGEELFDVLATEITNIENSIYQHVRPAYDTYIRERSVGSAAWDATLGNQVENPSLDQNWRNSLNEVLLKASRVEELMFTTDEPIPMSLLQEVVDDYSKVMMTAPNNLKVDWEGAWEGRFERNFGPLDWEPPKPANVFSEDGQISPYAYQPYIQRIVDGDTLIVSDHAGPQFLFNTTLEGEPRYKSVRLLGVHAREMGSDGGKEDRNRLVDYLTEARDEGRPIWLVRDPDTFGTNTDAYGRELAWLVIGEEGDTQPFYFPDELPRSVTPSGGE